MNYHRGREWYAANFAKAEPGQKLIDLIRRYIRRAWAPGRTARGKPDARIVLSKRDPDEHLRRSEGLLGTDLYEWRRPLRQDA